MADSGPTVAVLHPGRMGAAVARQAAGAGARVLWCPTGRGPATRDRAREAGLEAVDDLARLAGQSEIVVSLCPPAAAEQVAASVRDAGFGGLFVEANAISPQRMARIADDLAARGAEVVDGCVIGPPPGGGAAGGSRLYLSGPAGPAARVARLFTGTALGTVVVDGPVGKASALKMAYASFNKISAVLAALSHALAGAYGVTDQLDAEARRITGSHLADPERVPGVAARAWRWAPELREAAATFDAAGLPTELALASAAVLGLWEPDKDRFDLTVSEALDRLAGG